MNLGEFFEDQFTGAEGHGTWNLGRGVYYTGGVQHGKMYGHAEIKYSDGGKLVGCFENSTLIGKMTIEYPNGDEIEGTWNAEYGTLFGSGERHYDNGDIYIG